jgi:hypothetical protein
VKNRFLKLLRRRCSILDARFGVDIEGHSNTMSALVCRNLWIHSGMMAEARVSPPYDLEVHPAQEEQVCAERRRY